MSVRALPNKTLISANAFNSNKDLCKCNADHAAFATFAARNFESFLLASLVGQSQKPDRQGGQLSSRGSWVVKWPSFTVGLLTLAPYRLLFT